MKAVIIAAGTGGRLSALGAPKPLVPLCGRPILTRLLGTIAAAGLTEAIVVTGFMGDRIESHLQDDRAALPLPVRCIRNDAWQDGQHTSVLAAAGHVDGVFCLMMADHLFDPTSLADLAAEPLRTRDAVLAISTRLDDPTVDLDDVTRVRHRGSDLIALAKNLDDYTAFDTGLFACTPGLFDALERTATHHEPPSLSAGVQALADDGRAGVFDIGARPWIDIDDVDAHARAIRMIEAGRLPG